MSLSLSKTQQLAWGEGKIVLTVDIHCIGASSKMARSAHPKIDLLPIEMYRKGTLPWTKMYPS